MRWAAIALLISVGISLTGSPCVWVNRQVPARHRITPGAGVGGYTLGMSKDEILKKLGKSQNIEFGGNQVVRHQEYADRVRLYEDREVTRMEHTGSAGRE